MTKRITQKELVKQHLLKRGSITSWDAFQRYGCTRLSAKIYLLRKEGWDIKSENVTKKNRYGYMATFSKYMLNKKSIKF